MIRYLASVAIATLAVAGLVGALAAIASCGKFPADREPDVIPGRVYDYTLADGTRCVAWATATGSSIVCDFKGEIR